MAAQKKIPKRSEVDKQYTWATEDLFATDELWEKALEDAKKYIPMAETYKGRLGESADTLYGFLKARDEANLKIGRLANYAMRKSDEDTANSFYNAMRGKLMSYLVANESAYAFVTPEIIAIDDTKLDGFMQQKPELKEYERLLSRIRRMKAHTLSDAEERIMALAGQMSNAPGEIGSAFRNADIRFPDIHDAEGNALQVTQGSFIPLMENGDVNVRKAAFESLYHTFASFKHTTAAFLDAQMKTLIFNAQARHYDSTLEAALDETEVPVQVYHNLIDAVHNNIEHLHKYVNLRKKLMGVDELHIHRARLLDRALDRLFRDLVEFHAAFAFRVNAQNGRQMPRNRLALAVRVRREDDGFRALRLFADAFEHLAAVADLLEQRIERQHQQPADQERYADVERRVNAEIQPRKGNEQRQRHAHHAHPELFRDAEHPAVGGDGVLRVARGEGEARRARAGGLDDLERGVEHPGPRDAERDLQHLVDRRAGEAQEHEKIALVFVHAPEDHQHKEHEQRLAAELRHALHERVEQRSAQLGDGAQAVQIPFHKGSHSFLSTFFRKNEVKHGAL